MSEPSIERVSQALLRARCAGAHVERRIPAMRQWSSAVMVALLCWALAACVATAPVKAGSYPSRLDAFGGYHRFPASVAGYSCGDVTAFAPALANYAVGYNRYDGQLQSAVTLYFYPRVPGNQVEAEQAEVIRAHRGAMVRSSREVSIQGTGGVHNASLTTFEYDDAFAGRRQRVSSQLLLVLLPTSTFKVRSTAPLEQAEAAERAMLKLVEGVAWGP